MRFRRILPDTEVKNYSLLYTDGSAIGNGSPNCVGGWSYIVIEDEEIVRSDSGSAYGTTNNRMEMKAVLEGLKSFKEDKPVILYSDSQYVIKTLKGEYQVGKNHDMWKQIQIVLSKFTDVYFVWVRGHDKNYYNNMADEMATAASRKLFEELNKQS